MLSLFNIYKKLLITYILIAINVLCYFIPHLFGFYDEIERGGSSVIKNLMKSYRERSVLIGKSIVVNPLPGLEGDMYNAIVKNIDDNGFLVVETENHKEIVLNSGEVTLRSDKIIC